MSSNMFQKTDRIKKKEKTVGRLQGSLTDQKYACPNFFVT